MTRDIMMETAECLNGLHGCRYHSWQSGTFFTLVPECTKFKTFPFCFYCCVSTVSLQESHSLYQATLMLMSVKPQVLQVVLEVWHQSPPPISLGSNFPGAKLQGPQLSSLFSNNSSSECECVSDRMLMSIPEIEPHSFHLSLKIDLFSRAKQTL